MRNLILAFCMACMGVCYGQSLAVTATITDPDAQIWNNGTGTVTLIAGPNANYQGTPVSTAPQTFVMNGSGALAVTLFNSSTITPSGAQYQWTLCSNTSARCNTFLTGVTTTNLSALLSSFVTAPRFPASPTAFGYLDIEVTPVPLPGGLYFNVTTLFQRLWTGVAWVNGGGGSGAFTGSGTSGFIPVFTGPTALGNSVANNFISPGSNCLSIAGTLITYLCDIASVQSANTLNTTFNGTNWVYTLTGIAGAFRLEAGTGATDYQMALCPSGTAGGIVAMDGVCTAQWTINDGSNARTWFNSQIGAPTFPANAAFCLNPTCNYGANFDGSGFATTQVFSGSRTTQVATNQFVGSAIDFSQSRFPLAITGGTYSFDSQGTGGLIVVGASGGAVTSIVTIGAPGTGYAVGDLLTLPAGGSIGGNSDAVIRVTSVSAGGITGAQVIYGGTGYTGFGGNNITSAAVGRPFTFVLSGTLISNVQFIMKFGTFLTTSNQWIFANNTTGAFTVNVCEGNASDVCSGGSTINLAQGTANSRQVMLETDGVLNMFLAAVQNSLDLTFTSAAASNCNQAGTLTGVTGCMPVTVSGVTHFVPIF